MQVNQTRPISESIAEFNSIVSKLIAVLLQKTRSETERCNIERLKSRIILLKQCTGTDAVIISAKPYFIQHSAEITDLKKYESLILQTDARGEYLKTHASIASDDEFAFSLIDSVRTHYRAATIDEKLDVFRKVNTLLICCIEHFAFAK